MSELKKEQIEFLNKVCYGREYWKLNSNGGVDVDGSVFMYGLGVTEIPVKFGRVEGYFDCSNNNLTTLKNCPDYIGGSLNFTNNNLSSLDFFPDFLINNIKDYIHLRGNKLTDYFKSIKEEEFKFWDKLYWYNILKEYPFLINIGMKYINESNLKYYLTINPQTKLYLKE